MATLGFKSCQCFDSDAGREVQLFGRPLWTGRRRALNGRSACVGLVLGLLCMPAMPLAQQASPPPPLNGGAQQGAAPNDGLHPGANPGANSGANQDPMARHVEERMAERRNSERQKALVADTDRLLALAQELKTEVDKSNKDTLSIDVVKRAEQIEKLARSVKEKMRGS